jgi:hypothetical protein
MPKKPQILDQVHPRRKFCIFPMSVLVTVHETVKLQAGLCLCSLPYLSGIQMLGMH